MLHDNLHGGRKGHSPVTAITQLYNRIQYNNDKNKITVILCTDLGSAFETVDHFVLLKKLEHYGIRGQSNNIIKSYLSNRQQFVQLDTFTSELS